MNWAKAAGHLSGEVNAIRKCADAESDAARQQEMRSRASTLEVIAQAVWAGLGYADDGSRARQDADRKLWRSFGS
jgi:hypothetical protein